MPPIPGKAAEDLGLERAPMANLDPARDGLVSGDREESLVRLLARIAKAGSIGMMVSQGVTPNAAPIAHPTSALAIPIAAISSPDFHCFPDVTRAL